ncbi:hypothetical protein AA313_de0201311 [Arthrobotrys entomopaga]|nr:hypothetical protein AA313_de0201311 [Arthrobotrys entomopaga]
MSYTSTQGAGVIAEEPTKFIVQPRAGFTIISPQSSANLSGKFHLTIPRPPSSFNSITGIEVEFTSQTSTVNAYDIYMGKKEVATDSNLGWTTSQSETLATAISYKSYNAGIDVILTIDFESQASLIHLWSVNLQYA